MLVSSWLRISMTGDPLATLSIQAKPQLKALPVSIYERVQEL